MLWLVFFPVCVCLGFLLLRPSWLGLSWKENFIQSRPPDLVKKKMNKTCAFASTFLPLDCCFYVFLTAQIFIFHTRLKFPSCGRYPKLVSLLETNRVSTSSFLFEFSHFRESGKWFSLDDFAYADKKKDYNNGKKKHLIWEGSETGIGWFQKQGVQKHWFYCKTSRSLFVIHQKVAMAASPGYAWGVREQR